MFSRENIGKTNQIRLRIESGLQFVIRQNGWERGFVPGAMYSILYDVLRAITIYYH